MIRLLNTGISGTCFRRTRTLHLGSQTINQATSLQALSTCMDRPGVPGRSKLHNIRRPLFVQGVCWPSQEPPHPSERISTVQLYNRHDHTLADPAARPGTSGTPAPESNPALTQSSKPKFLGLITKCTADNDSDGQPRDDRFDRSLP